MLAVKGFGPAFCIPGESWGRDGVLPMSIDNPLRMKLMEPRARRDQSLTNSWYSRAVTLIGSGAVLGSAASQSDAAVVTWNANGLNTVTGQNFLFFDFDTGNSVLSGSTALPGYDVSLSRNAVSSNVFTQLRFASGVAAQVLGTFTGGYAYPTRLAAGAPIGPAGSFFITSSPSGGLASLAGSPESVYPRGNWDGANLGTPGFVGLRFGTPGNYNYAWAEVTVMADRHVRLNRFAIQTTPNTAINTPVPEVNSLALLALGGAGLALHRRRRKEMAA